MVNSLSTETWLQEIFLFLNQQHARCTHINATSHILYTIKAIYVSKYTLQIADFGMSRDLLDENYYITSGGKIPVKWTAPEVCSCIINYKAARDGMV